MELLLLLIPIFLTTFFAELRPADAADANYAVVVSRATREDPGWSRVVDALVEKHDGAVIVYGASVDESLDGLRQRFPRYACFVATRSEAGREFVARVHRLTRRLDDDPYTDVLWGILTGYDANGALRIAKRAEPLVVRRVAAGTPVALESCEEGVWYSEGTKGLVVRKEPGEKPVRTEGPADTTKALVDEINGGGAQLFVTSGHATERDWQIGYSYKNGQFRSKAGQLFGLDTRGRRFDIHSQGPRVYLPVGNCLMGHVDGPDAMALAWMNSAGVHQMAGYTVSTWYGYAGWGCLDYFLKQPGRFTLAEAFFANQQALLAKLAAVSPELALGDRDVGGQVRISLEEKQSAERSGLAMRDLAGLLFDRDALAFYGDPAWEARMAPGPLGWKQTLTESGGVYRFRVEPQGGEASLRPPGGRPIFQLLPHRVRGVEILEGGNLRPVVTDNFILVPSPGEAGAEGPFEVVFRAQRAG